MALSYKPVMTDDGGTRRKKEEEVTTKAPSNVGAGLAAAEQARQQTQTQTPYEKRQAEIRAGVNKAKPISYAAPEKQKQEEPEEEQQPIKTSGGMTIPTRNRAADYAKAQEDLDEWNREQEEKAQPNAPASQAVIPQTTAEATEAAAEKESKPRRSGEYRAEANTDKITYTGGKIAKKNTNVGTASQTKAAITGEEEEEPQWMRDLAEANAEDRRRRQAVANANQELAIRAMNAGPQYDPETVQRVRDQTLAEIEARKNNENAQYLAENGFSWTGNPSMSADRMKTGGAAEDTGSKNIWDRISAGIASSTNQQQGRINQELTTYGNRNTQGAKTPEEEARDQLANNQQYLAEEGFSWTANPAMNAKREMYASENKMTESNDVLVRQQMINELTTEAFANGADPDDPSVQKRIAEEVDKAIIRNGMEEYRKKYPVTNAPTGGANNTDVEADAIAAGLEPGTKEFNDYVNNYYKVKDNRTGRQKDTDKGYSYSPDNTSSRTTNNRPGAAAEVASWEDNQGWIQQDNKEGGVIDESTKPRPDKNGNATTNAAGNPVTTGSTQSTTQNSTDKSSNPKGTQYLTPSYGQGGKVVKLPYKSGGYTEAELMALGNKAYGTKYGANVYEGYYQAPDGHYYPVDQEKAAYYLRNGYSYEGWEEPMRDYYNTFGTFYGYRKDWKQAGKAGNNYSYSPRSYSYSAGGGSSRSSYGRGSTPNNGMYWNGLTSWNA
jgi:hypothetical protein